MQDHVTPPETDNAVVVNGDVRRLHLQHRRRLHKIRSLDARVRDRIKPRVIMSLRYSYSHRPDRQTNRFYGQATTN